jgi:arylamine N-acetyltransferase
MENDTRIDEYLKRIEVNRPTNGPDKEYLIQLHIGHLTHIPFETIEYFSGLYFRPTCPTKSRWSLFSNEWSLCIYS